MLQTLQLYHPSLIGERTFQAGQCFLILLAFLLPLSTAGTTISVVGIILCWLLSGAWKNKIQLGLSHTLVRGMLALFALTLLGITYSDASWGDISGSLRDANKFCLIFFILPFCQSPKVTHRALFAFVFALFIALLCGGAKMFDWVAWGQKYSEATVFKNHIVTNYLMAFAAFIVAHQVAYKRKYQSLLSIIGLLMIIYIFFMSAGRTGYIISGLLMVLFGWQHQRWRGLLKSIGLLMAIIFLALQFSDVFTERVFHQAEEFDEERKATSIEIRKEFAQTSLSLALENPWFGKGTGSFHQAYSHAAEARGKAPTQNPHNEYLHLWVELGVPGLLLLFLVFQRMWSSRKALPSHRRHLAEGLTLSFVVGCFGNSLLMDFTEGHFIALMMALIYAPLAYGQVKKNFITPRRRAEKCPVYH